MLTPFDYTQIIPGAVEWFQEAGFVKTADSNECWEKAYSHTCGYGFVTIRWWPNSFGWDAIVESGDGSDRDAVNVGTCQTVEHMKQIWALLEAFDYHPKRARLC